MSLKCNSLAISRQATVNAPYQKRRFLALALFVFWFCITDNAHYTFATDHFAVPANLFY